MVLVCICGLRSEVVALVAIAVIVHTSHCCIRIGSLLKLYRPPGHNARRTTRVRSHVYAKGFTMLVYGDAPKEKRSRRVALKERPKRWVEAAHTIV